MRLARLHGLAGTYLAAVLALAVPPAAAQTQQHIDWCANKGNAFLPDLAIRGCTAAIQSGQFSGKALAAAFDNRGNAYTVKGDHDRAISDYDQAIRLDPEDFAALFARGKAYSAKGDYGHAIAGYQAAGDLASKQYDRAVADTDKAIDSGQFDRADALLEETRRLLVEIGQASEARWQATEAQMQATEAQMQALATGLKASIAEQKAAEDRRIADSYQKMLEVVRKANSGSLGSPELSFIIAYAILLPDVYAARARNLAPDAEALDLSLNLIQRAFETSAARALSALAARFAVGNSRLAQLVRNYQDITAEQKTLADEISRMPIDRFSRPKPTDKPKGDLSKMSAERDRAKVQRSDDLGNAQARLMTAIRTEFPDFGALLNPKPLNVKEIHPLLADDEALVVVEEKYVWVVTNKQADWRQIEVTREQVSERVSQLRDMLDWSQHRSFDANPAFTLYRQLFGPIENIVAAKARLSFVLSGALTSLPPQLLVTRDPAGKALKDVDWLSRTHAVTVLPSVASLKVLRSKSAAVHAKKALIGFADPVFDRDLQRLQQNARVAANLAASRGARGAVADIEELRRALPPLPDTANELRQVAASVKADPADVILGPDATVSRVKREKLDLYRIVYFATHGLLAGDVADFAKLKAEPALVLSLPEKPTELDDGLLTASEVAQLKLNADWVVLSACNTASGEKPGAEALSGLARAFFYAGGRSILVSNWEVETKSAVALMVGTFAALAADPKLSHGEALQKSMMTLIDDAQHPEWADPKYWAPFVVVGEPAKLAK